jgi:glucose/mannose-6-phosphate isomerase
MSEESIQPEPYDAMLSLVGALPDQLAEAERFVPRLERLPRRPPRVWVCGMGGSAIAAELLGACGGLGLPELGVHRSYGAPRVDLEGSLVVFSSYSGETEEVLSAYEACSAAGKNITCIVLSAGGALAARAVADGIPVLTLPSGLPPRATLGWGVGALLHCFARLGVAEGVEAGLAEADTVLRAASLELGPASESASNPARRLARRLYGKLPLLYAGCPLTTAAAWRWKAQINENSKALAYVASLPELDHNEIVGFGAASGLPERSFILALRDGQEHPRVHRRFNVTEEILAPGVHGFEALESRGSGELARILSLAQFGDYLSVYLAQAYGVDPMAIEAIDRLKGRLSE